MTHLNLDIRVQPDDITCGPTCLHAVYRYYGDSMRLRTVIDEVAGLSEGGTLAVMLACHALRRGYRATIYTYNLTVFDPTWFTRDDVDMSERIRAQMEVKTDAKLHAASHGYLDYLSLGGEIRFEELSRGLIRRYLKRGRPILTGLSATYLYRCPRERDAGPTRLVGDDVRGEPTGHFVVVCGYDAETKEVLVADPLSPNPVSDSQRYHVPIDRLLNAILLGIVTYDSNLLILEPKPPAPPKT
jgi:hypothetical protein